MKFVLLSDVHLVWENPIARMDNLVDVQWDKLAFVFDYARDINATILDAGDLFDKPRSWALLPRLIQFIRHYQVPIYGIFGQHDTYMYSEETRERTNLGVLERAGLVRILDEERKVLFDHGNVQVFGASFGQELPKVERKGVTVGVIHASISDRPAYPGHQYSEMARYLKENDSYDLILCGDIHRMFHFEKDGRRIVNVGPMTRQEATEYNFTHVPGFGVYDTSDNSLDWVDIPAQPAEKVLSRDHIERKKESEELLKEFVGALGGEQVVDGVSFIDNLWQFVKENKIEKPVIDILAEVVNDNRY